jgi:hypothetical protein
MTSATSPWSALRIFALAAGALGTLFWIGAVVQWWRVEDSHRDGFELLGVILAHIFLVALVLPTLVLGVLNRWLILAACTGIAVLVLASDTLWPWVPWP